LIMSDENSNVNNDDVNTQPVKKPVEPVHDDVNTQPVVKPKDDLNSGEDVLDPLTLRDSDTSKLKRVKPKSATQTVNLDAENVTDTVHLKVIKEKKKQLAGILTASQTIRLRPPSSPVQSPADGQGAPAPQSNQTLKVSMPPASGGTVSMPPTGGGSAGTLKINMPASSSESGTIKVSKPNFAEPSSSGTLKIKGPASSADASSGTLKIKSAASVTTDGSGTLKIKGPASTADETLKITSEDKGGTVKLKAKAAPSAADQSRSKTATASDEAVVEEIDPKSQPGIFMALSSFVALVAVGTIVFLCVNNYMELFSVAVDK
jgi:hypothetical protein